MQGQLQFEWYDIERDPTGWDDSVSGAGQNLFHRSATLAAEQRARSVRRGVVVKRFGARVCLLGGLVTPQETGGVFHALSFPPAGDRVAADLPERIVNWLLYQGLTTIHIGSRAGGVEGYQVDGRTGRASDRLEFIYDLSMDEAQRLRAADAGHRHLFHRAAREPMILRRIDRRQAWLMARLNAAWARRRGERVDLVRLINDYRYYRRLAVQMKHDRSGNLYGLYEERGRMLAMAYMLERGNTSFYLMGASSEDGDRRGAPVRLFFELARHYPSVGVHVMNFGDVPAQACSERHKDFGRYRFKMGFGTEPVLRRSLVAKV